MRLTVSISLLILVFSITSCASKKHKNISYLEETTNNQKLPTLNIFSPKNAKFTNNPVLIFVHGGNWNSGDKDMYGFIGRNFAKRGITTVIVGYSLSPEVDYDSMAKQVAVAVTWTKNNIAAYKGNPNEIFLTGHSAGGHLIALIGTNPKYLEDKSIIKGIIFNDAAGLDIKSYLEKNPPTTKFDYLTTWGSNSKQWVDASPLYFIDKSTPKLMVYLGSKTYESIKVENAKFMEEANKFQSKIKLIILNKKHAPMVKQYINPWSNRYNEIITFMKTKY